MVEVDACYVKVLPYFSISSYGRARITATLCFKEHQSLNCPSGYEGSHSYNTWGVKQEAYLKAVEVIVKKHMANAAAEIIEFDNASPKGR